MADEKPYLDPNLTLRGLAQIMEIPPNHLSQLLNEGFDKNFAEYINSYRVETFKLKAADPEQQHPGVRYQQRVYRHSRRNALRPRTVFQGR